MANLFSRGHEGSPSRRSAIGLLLALLIAGGGFLAIVYRVGSADAALAYLQGKTVHITELQKTLAKEGSERHRFRVVNMTSMNWKVVGSQSSCSCIRRTVPDLFPPSEPLEVYFDVNRPPSGKGRAEVVKVLVDSGAGLRSLTFHIAAQTSPNSET